MSKKHFEGEEVMSYAHCDACGRSQYECLCRETCAECGIRTNHTTAQHQAAQRVMCRECDVVEVHDEDQVCAECLSELASYYEPDQGGENG